RPVTHLDSLSFPTRRSSDLTLAIHHENFYEETQHTARIGSWEVNMAHRTATWSKGLRDIYEVSPTYAPPFRVIDEFYPDPAAKQDRTSTRLNSSHGKISYAV